MQENFTIIDKRYLERLEQYYRDNTFETIRWLTIDDVKNIDVALPSIVQFLKNAWLKLREERIYTKEHDKSLEIIWAMNILRELVVALEQQKINELREEYNKQQSNLNKDVMQRKA